MSQARQLYQQVVQRHKPSESETTKIIEDGHAVKAFRQTRTARLLNDFVAKQREGLTEYMHVEIGGLNGLNLVKWFNAFLKYTYLVQEDRAYRKIEAFLESIEKNGERYEELKRRQAERSSKDSTPTG